jgi:pimeloyl-ACP methyl ester carboxylesterase
LVKNIQEIRFLSFFDKTIFILAANPAILLRMNTRYKSLNLIFAFTLMVSGYPFESHVDQTKPPSEKHIMAVFIHGTMLPIPSLSAFGSSLHRYFSRGRGLRKSWYQLYLDKLKTSSTYRYQPSGPDGFNPVTTQQCASIAAAMYQEFFPESCSCYTFGWDGRLSNRHRRKAAHQLYQSLCTEIDRLKANCKNLEVMVIGHSHGGNVALYLAHAEQNFKKKLTIDKLVLLGTPVQSETEGYVSASCFKKVYNFFSRGDQIQKIDRISTRDAWSKRKFTPHENLIQVELRCGKKQPGHAELWLFGGKDNWVCRSNLSVAPFPIFAFLPVIIRELDARYSMPSTINLNIERRDNALSFSYSDTRSTSTALLDSGFLKKYRDKIVRI